jgi:hypothetical protein
VTGPKTEQAARDGLDYLRTLDAAEALGEGKHLINFANSVAGEGPEPLRAVAPTVVLFLSEILERIGTELPTVPPQHGQAAPYHSCTAMSAVLLASLAERA